jgi:[histone H3]-lysine4 N-trimethyltransferase ASH1L
MPLRQSILSFVGSAASTQASKPSRSANPRPTPSRTATSSTDAEDTIVVALPDERTQLPTPSESVTDVSSQGTDVMSMKEVSKGRAKRVSRRLTNNQSGACLLESMEDEQVKDRTVSGETLVNNATMSQTSLMKNGIAALNLPWSMSAVFDTGSKAELLRRKNAEPAASTESLDTLTTTDYDEEERREKAAAKKAKMEENKNFREQEWKVEDAKANRRSSRASMLDKASVLVSNLASSVLGKRKDRVAELRGTTRPHSAMDSIHVNDLSPAPYAKRRRLSDNALPADASVAQIRRAIRAPRDKKWLVSGLYAGQPRTFEPRLTESKNKRKSTSAITTVASVDKDSTVLPLPMFAGERLITQGRDFKLPFDVFSPLPAGQPKPDEWRRQNKNTFVGDASQEWRISKFIEHSTCMCKADFGCDQDCMNRFMYYECDERNCNLTAEQCGNRAFEGLRQRAKKGGKYNIGVEVIKTADKGYGVRSNRTFAPNQIIVEYTGEIVTQEECEGRMRGVYKDNEVYLPPMTAAEN